MLVEDMMIMSGVVASTQNDHHSKKKKVYNIASHTFTSYFVLLLEPAAKPSANHHVMCARVHISI